MKNLSKGNDEPAAEDRKLATESATREGSGTADKEATTKESENGAAVLLTIEPRSK